MPPAEPGRRPASDRPLSHVAIVTGANHGIGAATAERLAAQGVSVLVTYFRNRVADDPGTPERYQENRMTDGSDVAARINSAGGRAVAVEFDLLNAPGIPRLFDRAEAEFGPVDILINNATGWSVGDSFVADIDDGVGRTTRGVTAELFDRTFGVDARAGALLIAEFARRHLERGGTWGRIVGLTSGGPHGFPSEVTYGAAKAAQENYTFAAATELAPHGVTANIVYPPVTDTGWVTDDVRTAIAANPQLVHIAEPGDVAEVIAWLCTDAARLVSGTLVRLR